MLTAVEIIGGGVLGLISFWFAWQNQKLLKAIYEILTKGKDRGTTS
jgi:hypothetical protein